MSFDQPRNGSRRYDQSNLPLRDGPGLGDRLPPQNLDAERGVLGAIMLDNDVFDDVAEIIKTHEDFYRDSHRIIYEQMMWMRANGKAIDAVTLADRLERTGDYKKIGGDDALAEIANSVPHAANAAYHADIVRQKAITRDVIQASTDNIRDGYSNLLTAQEYLDSAERKIFAIRDKEVSSHTVGIMDAVNEAIVLMDKIKNGGEIGWLLTGINELDKILLGFQGGQLIVLAGRPGAGKSAFAAQLAAHVSGGQNESTLMISLEMKAVEYARRMISAQAAINSKLLKNSVPLQGHEEDRINQGAARVAMTRLRIDDSPTQSLSQIAANARRWRRKDNLGFLCVDYLQQVEEPSARGESRTTVVGRISRGLKKLASELNIPILALCQLNRESEKDDRPPRMSDIRECGNIEQDADVILLLHNKTPKGDPVGPVDMVVAKNRDGEEGIVPLVYNRALNTFAASALPGQIRSAPDPDELRASDFPSDDYRSPDDDDPDYDDFNVVPFNGR